MNKSMSWKNSSNTKTLHCSLILLGTQNESRGCTRWGFIRLRKRIPTANPPRLLSHLRQLQPRYQAQSLAGPYRLAIPSTPTAELQPRRTWADISHNLMTPRDVQDSMWPQDTGTTCVWWPVVTWQDQVMEGW